MVTLTLIFVASVLSFFFSLLAIYWCIDVLLRTEKKLKLSYQYRILAWVIFAVMEVAVIGEELLWWKIGHYRELFLLLFILLLIVSSWFLRRAIRDVRTA